MSIDFLAFFFPILDKRRSLFIVDQLPAAVFDSRQRSARTVVGQTFCPESAPVIRYDLIQRADNIVERICLHLRRTVWCPVERMAEVIDRLRSLRLLADDRVHPQPVQNIFIVVVESTPP